MPKRRAAIFPIQFKEQPGYLEYLSGETALASLICTLTPILYQTSVFGTLRIKASAKLMRVSGVTTTTFLVSSSPRQTKVTSEF